MFRVAEAGFLNLLIIKYMNKPIAILLIVVSCFTLIIVFINNGADFSKENRNELLKIQRYMERNALVQSFSISEPLNRLSLVNCSDTSLKFNEVVRRNKRLVLLVPQSPCQGCLDEELKNLSKVSAAIGDTNIVLVTRFYQKRDANMWKLTQHIGYEVYNSPEYPVFQKIEEANQLFLFIVDSTYQPVHGFIPTPYLPDMTNKYYSFVKNLFIPGNPDSENDPEEYVWKVDKQQYDFGNIKKNHTVETSFMLTNTGTEPLIVYSIDASCDCISVTWEKSPILPARKRKIIVSFRADYPGPFSHKLLVSTDRKGAADRSLVISGNVASE